MQRLFDLLTRQYRILRIRFYFIGCSPIEYPGGVGRRLRIRIDAEASRLIRRQRHLGRRCHPNPTDPRELNRNGHVLRTGISDDRKMQVRTGGKTGIAGVGYVLPARDPRANAYADRVPVKMGIDGNRPVIVEDLDDIGLVEHDWAGTGAEGVMTDVDHGALPR
jgi:hypothetical protein